VIGLVIALALAVLISDSIARPLRTIGRAARRIADGDYQQRVPVGRPREVGDLALAFNQMAARVAASQQTQREFLANVSHDLRTPLTSIQGFSQAIAEGVTSDPGSAARAAQIIHDEAARLNRMVDSLLDLARIEAHQGAARREPLDLAELLRGTVERLEARLRERGLSLQLDLARDLPRVRGDGDRLAQVFTNLLDNALEHTPSGGTIRLGAQRAEEGVRVTVQDTGTGIPAADLPHIFDRFYQVDKSRQRGRRAGMGLGLAICRQIVEAHGGTITLASEEGRGTTATVWLPA
jgi:signal transduction histidine kinase